MNSTQYLDYHASHEFLEYLGQERSDLYCELDVKRQVVLCLDDQNEKLFEFRPPLPFLPIENETITVLDFISKENIDDIPTYTILLMQAGAAALGFFEEGEVRLHKTIKKYMTRRKQGKAQINYLNTRGKSKAGSRVRLANTVRFFEEINEYLTDWEEYEPPEKLFISCTARLWGLLFQAKVPAPFAKDDPRIIRIPMDVHTPTHEELLRVNRFLLKGELRWYQDIDLGFAEDLGW